MPAYTTTLSQIRTSPELAEVANVCPSSSTFVGLINTAQRRLLKRGGWFDTEQLVRFCIYDRCLTMPQYLGALLGVRGCSCSPATVMNHWYSIIGASGCWGSQGVITETGTAPTYNTIANPLGSKIRYHVVKRNDVGKTITLFGTFYGGQPLQELDADGNWKMGLTITSAAPFAQTSKLISHITSVTRQATQGMSYLYEVYDEPAGTLRDLAVYGPNETNPRYRNYKLDGCPCFCSCEDANGRRISSIEALVKLAFVPLVDENDFLLIDDPDALSYMVQAIRYGRTGDAVNDEIYMRKSVNELNMNDRNLLPKEGTPVAVFTGGRGVRNLF